MSPGGTPNEHITDVKWRDDADGEVNYSSKATMVDWIDNKNGHAYVQGQQSRSDVGTVHEAGATPYLRTYANGYYNDNLLSLPTF
ncbi:hypothetical protein JOE30_000892 [Rhodococcus sp. PvP016]|uniref:DUF3892 domain-containing protein n=2 Tax=Mycobacteriales TaxID=85007 RepID=A0ABS2KY57_9NOCA|nr:hypothetical protein [Rhodococcus corynebacterioides]MBP1115095.1 hypothetical protein [Rhodococcus sp. PvP016]